MTAGDDGFVIATWPDGARYESEVPNIDMPIKDTGNAKALMKTPAAAMKKPAAASTESAVILKKPAAAPKEEPVPKDSAEEPVPEGKKNLNPGLRKREYSKAYHKARKEALDEGKSPSRPNRSGAPRPKNTFVIWKVR